MKLRAVILLCIPLMLAGCTPTATNPATLAPGYLNAADQTMGQILAGARSFYISVQQQSASGQMTLSATEKTAFNSFEVSLNAGDAVYLAYHSGSATQAQAQAAVNLVQQQQAALPLPGASK